MKAKKLVKRKEVEYYGMKLLVKNNMKYIAVDGYNEMFAFTHKPIPVDVAQTWIEDTEKNHRDFDLELLGTVKFEKGEEWCNTLRKI